MTTISIPREKLLELIKKDSCVFYDYNNYYSLEINVIFDRGTELKEFESSSILELSFRDLANLLFDKVVKVNNDLFITVF